MESLFIPASEGEFVTPEVNFNIDSNPYHFEITGESFIENTDEFYEPILAWLSEFVARPPALLPLLANFKFTYYNSSSSKSILKIMNLLKEYSEKSPVEANWYYPSINEELYQEGVDYQNMTGLNISIYEFEL